MQQAAGTEVVIIGAGFAGLEVARGLGRAGIATILIDRTNHHLFQPLLYQVATAALAATDVAEPIRRILRRYPSVRVLMGEVSEIDPEAREIRLAGGERLPYRLLVLASGAGHGYFGHEEWGQWAPGLKTVEDARRIRSRLLLTFEQAERSPDPAERDRLLSVAIIGGGPTGVELAGAIAELSRHTLARDFRDIDPATMRITLVEAGPRLLPGFSDDMARYAQHRLERRGIRVRLDEAVEDVGPGTIRIAGRSEPVGLVIWAAGVAASPLARQLGETDKAGRLPVEDTLAVRGQTDVYALGDVAALEGPDGIPLPGLAQVARQQGIHLGRGLAAMLTKGRPLQPFRYRSRGNTAMVARNAAVFEQGRLRIRGWPAWLGWAVIHVYLLVGFQNRLLVTTQWIWRYLTHDRGARLISPGVRPRPIPLQHRRRAVERGVGTGGRAARLAWDRRNHATAHSSPPRRDRGPAMTLRVDVAVIGAGTAGLAAERSARTAGASTLLIDPHFAGTTCATTGCMPSKLLIAAADAAHAARGAEEFGVHASPRIDGAAVMARVRRLRDDFARGVREQISKLPEGVARRASARFTGANRLALSDGETVEARAIVAAPGARPLIPKPYRELPHLLTNENVFELSDLPESLCVLGGGPIGLELAQAFARLGTRVHLFDTGERLAGLRDGAVSDCLRDIMGKEMRLHLGVEAEAEAREGGLRLTWQGGSEQVEKLLIATGRPPALDGLDLAAAGLVLDEHGMPEVDPATLRCGDSAVFLAGDGNGLRPVLHEASAEGTIAGTNAAHYPQIHAAPRSVPFVLTFTRPEIAEIGEIGAEGHLIGSADYRGQGRARVEARDHGLVRLYAEPATGRLTGAALCLPDGGHIAHLLAWAIAEGWTAADLLDRPRYHPTLEEGLTGALADLCRQSALPRPWTRDDGPRPGNC